MLIAENPEKATTQEKFNSKQITEARKCIAAANLLIADKENEQRVRDSFTSRLRSMFPNIPQWVEEHIVGGEAAVKTTINEEARVGFVDNLVGLTAIEYEANLNIEAKFKEGFGQVKKYCAALINAGNDPETVIGVLSDTVTWVAYRIKGLTDPPINGKIEADHLELEVDEQIDISGGTDGDAAKLLSFLTLYLQRSESRPLNAGHIARDLGFVSPHGTRHIAGVFSTVELAFNEKKEYGAMIAKLWCDFVSYVTSKGKVAAFDLSEYANELYILILGKLVCANLLGKKAFISDDKELSLILNGKYFEERGFRNFVEYDYFGWFNDESAYRDTLIPVAREMQYDLRAYNFSYSPEEDLFGQLMSQLAQRSQRLLLGQEWTPSWLARATVRNVISNIPENQDPHLVDMCCGSGGMIVEAVLQVKNKLDKNEETLSDASILRRLENTIVGFDIDPLAVMLAKINWIAAALDCIPKDGSESVSIPIYHADSLFAMTPLSKSIDNGDDTIELRILEHSLALPKFLISAKWQGVFDIVLDRSYSLATSNNGKVSLSIEDAQAISKAACIEASTDASDDQLKQCAGFLVAFTEKVNELDLEGRNGIWAFVMRNSYRPALVAGQFNGLVSNPPWLAMSKIADNPYKGSLSKLGDDYGVKPKGQSAHHLEMAIVFLLYAIDRYLVEGAAVGCILPDAVLNGHQHTRFRKGEYRSSNKQVPFIVNEIWSIEKSAFKNLAIAVFGKKDQGDEPENFLGKKIFSPEKAEETAYYKISKPPLYVWSEHPKVDVKNIFSPANFQQGADIMPRRFWLHEATHLPKKNAYSLTSIEINSPLKFLMSDAKEMKDFRLGAKCVVPESLVYDFLLSKLVAPFLISRPVKAFLPIKRNELNDWECLSFTEMAGVAKAKRAQAEFSKMATLLYGSGHFQNFWKSPNGKKGLNYRNKLSKQSSITGDGYLVFSGAGGKNVCSAILPMHQVPRPDRIIIDQTLYWVQIKSLREAIYLCGMLNSDPVNELIKTFQPRGQQGERHVHELAFGITPPFDKTRPDHLEVVRTTILLTKEYYNRLRTAKRTVRMAEIKGEKVDKQELRIVEAMPPTKRLQNRRKTLKEVLYSLDAYKTYDAACRAIYSV